MWVKLMYIRTLLITVGFLAVTGIVFGNLHCSCVVSLFITDKIWVLFAAIIFPWSCGIMDFIIRRGMYFDSNVASAADMRYFNWLVLVVQLLGVISVVITAVWMGHYRGGFAWQTDPDHEFNYHPLFMIIGMVFLYADAILAYRVFRNDRKICIKVLHASMHVFALIFASVGLKAVFDSHNLKKPDPIRNLYSLHSWLGIFVVVAFGLQWLLGFVSFLWPKLGMGARTMYMPYHTFWGVTLLILATATALMGITEKTIFHSVEIGYSHLSPESILINCLGVILVLFTGLVIYLVTKPEYKRQPAPEEDHVPLDN